MKAATRTLFISTWLKFIELILLRTVFFINFRDSLSIRYLNIIYYRR